MTAFPTGSNRANLLIFLGLLVSVVCIWSGLVRSWVFPRPMFHEDYSDLPITPPRYYTQDYHDLSGNIVYVDRELNVVLVIATRVPGHTIPETGAFETGTPTQATFFLLHSQTAVEVTWAENELIIICPDEFERRFPLPDKGAEAVFRRGSTVDLVCVKGSNWLEEIVKILPPPQAEEMREFLKEKSLMDGDE